jgi:hypothetical protein
MIVQAPPSRQLRTEIEELEREASLIESKLPHSLRSDSSMKPLSSRAGFRAATSSRPQAPRRRDQMMRMWTATGRRPRG